MDISLAKMAQIIQVSESKNFSRAAEVLGISQPALSRNIAAIEERYGIRLFDRGRAGAVLTASGRLIVEEAAKVLLSAKRLENNLKLYGNGEAGQISFGISPPVASLILAPLSMWMFSHTSKLQVSTLIRPPSALLQALLDDEIEFFVCPDYCIEPSDGLKLRFIGKMDAKLFVRAEHPLLTLSRVDLNDLRKYPVTSPIAPNWLFENGESAKTLACDNFHIMRDITLNSDVVLICPTKFVEQQIIENQILALNVPDAPSMDVDIVLGSISGRTHSPIALEAIAFCRKFFAS